MKRHSGTIREIQSEIFFMTSSILFIAVMLNKALLFSKEKVNMSNPQLTMVVFQPCGIACAEYIKN